MSVMLAMLVLGGGCALEPSIGELRSTSNASEAGVPATASNGDAGDGDAAVRPVSFARDVRPLLWRDDGPPSGCRRCHDPSAPDPQGTFIGGLDMSTLGNLRRGGVSSGRRVVVPFAPDESAIVQKLEGTYPRGARMPKDRAPWAPSDVAVVRRWILEGAVGDDSE